MVENGYKGIKFEDRYLYPELWLLEQITEFAKEGLVEWKTIKDLADERFSKNDNS